MFNRDNYVTRFNDMLTLRDLAESTVNNYTSYLNQYLDFVESSLNGKFPEDVSWEEIRSYILQLKNVRNLNNRSINPHIAQLIFFFKYVLHREWDRYQVPFLRYLLFPQNQKWKRSSIPWASTNTSASLPLCIPPACV